MEVPQLLEKSVGGIFSGKHDYGLKQGTHQREKCFNEHLQDFGLQPMNAFRILYAIRKTNHTCSYVCG